MEDIQHIETIEAVEDGKVRITTNIVQDVAVGDIERQLEEAKLNKVHAEEQVTYFSEKIARLESLLGSI